MMSYMFVISIQKEQCQLIADNYSDELDTAELYLKTNETEYAEVLSELNTIVTTYQTKVNDFLNKNRDEPDTSEYESLIKLQESEQYKFDTLLEDTGDLELTFQYMFERFNALTFRIRSISKVTGL